MIKFVTLKLARADAHKGNTVPVIGIEVGVYFENKSRKLGVLGGDEARLGQAGTRLRRNFHKGVQQFFDAKIVQGAAKKHRSLLSGQVGFPVKSAINIQ